MIEKVRNWCEKHHLVQREDTILLACSGGPDSLALVDIFLRLQPVYQLHLAVAHLDHMFRGAASAADAAFVQAFCRQRALPCFLRCVDVAAYAQETGMSDEEAAREVRYAFLREIAQSLGGAKIATGHHRDDQAETVLLHLLRGAGSAGIAGIRPESCGIIRPFLPITRREIETYCTEHALAARIDATNLTADCCTRNRIRLELLPELEKIYNPLIKAALCRTAELVGTEHDFVRQSAEAAYRNLVVKLPNGEIQLILELLKSLHIAIKREIFRLAIEGVQGHVKGIGFFHIEQLIRFSEEGRSGTLLELPGGLQVLRTYEALHFSAVAHQDIVAGKELAAIVLQIPGITATRNLPFVIETEILTANQRPRNKQEIVCDLDALALPLYLRSRKQGDRFQPLGMRGSKKIKDFFIDAKIERTKREQIPLICDQQDVVWIAGLRQSEKGKVTAATRRWLLLRIKEI